MELNYCVVQIFAPLLGLVGLLGFIVPEQKSPTSGAPADNLFHIAFSCLGLALLFYGEPKLMRAFNILFGLIDLYQGLASRFGWFPREQFKWKKADDVLHVVIGLGLLSVC